MGILSNIVNRFTFTDSETATSKGFKDGITDISNALVNQRNVLNKSRITARTVDYEELRSIYKTGLGSKIVRLKAAYALNDTLDWTDERAKIFFDGKLSKKVKLAVRFMLAFGRGIIVIHQRGDDLSTPLRNETDINRLRFDVFSGDMVTAGGTSVDLDDDRYMKPMMYVVRGHYIHPSRVIDFTYVEPPELDAPLYNYGGISEFELIYSQLVGDSVVERSSVNILEKNANWVYKVAGLKDAMRSRQDEDIVRYFSRVEDMRSMYGSVLLDADDDAQNIAQTLTNLSDVDQTSLRRVAMVTGIPLSVLVGENVKGLNSSGDNERAVFQDTIENLQTDFIYDPVNLLLSKLGFDQVRFKENQGDTALSRIQYDKIAVDIAVQLTAIGEDGAKYLADKGVIKPDNWDSFFSEPSTSNQEAANLLASIANESN